jgi:charged multivesicular body protein 4
MFRRLFGESKSKDSTRSHGNDNQHRDALRTITHLQQSEDMMTKKLEKFDEEIADIQNKARQCLAKSNPDRSGAIRLIKRRKQLEQQRDKLWQMKQNIELVNEQVQASHFNRQVTDSLNIGQQHLKRAQKSMPTKKIEEIIDNITEQIDMSNDINDLLAAPILTNDLSTTDYDLENELNNLNNEIIAENMVQINLPAAHSGAIKVKDIDQQLAELQRLTTG